MNIQIDSDFFCDVVRLVRLANAEKWKLNSTKRNEIKFDETVKRLEIQLCHQNPAE